MNPFATNQKTKVGKKLSLTKDELDYVVNSIGNGMTPTTVGAMTSYIHTQLEKINIVGCNTTSKIKISAEDIFGLNLFIKEVSKNWENYDEESMSPSDYVDSYKIAKIAIYHSMMTNSPYSPHNGIVINEINYDIIGKRLNKKMFASEACRLTASLIRNI